MTDSIENQSRLERQEFKQEAVLGALGTASAGFFFGFIGVVCAASVSAYCKGEGVPLKKNGYILGALLSATVLGAGSYIEDRYFPLQEEKNCTTVSQAELSGLKKDNGALTHLNYTRPNGTNLMLRDSPRGIRLG